MRLSSVLGGFGITTFKEMEAIRSKRLMSGIENSELRLIQTHLEKAHQEAIERDARRAQQRAEPKPKGRCKPDPLCWISWCEGDYVVVEDEDTGPYSAMITEKDDVFEGYYVVQLLRSCAKPPTYHLWERTGMKHSSGQGQVGEVCSSSCITSFMSLLLMVPAAFGS